MKLYQRQRPPGYSYGDARWRRLRAAVLAEEPTCRLCGAPSQVVDHVVARRRFPLALQLSEEEGGASHRSNLRGLCKSCHSRRRDDKSRA